jgi:hypothetical protein
MLSDRQLDNVHAGNAVADAHSADANSSAQHSGDLWIAGAASSAAACKLKIFDSVDNDGQDNTGANAQTIVNTLASVNAVQINVAAAGGTQTNKAYSAEGALGEIDSDQAASADSAASAGNFTHFASADSSASAATSASSALAFATPRVDVKNKCGAQECKLKINNNLRNNGDFNSGANAQSILNTVASVNAVQMNVAGGASIQSNVAFSGGGL